METVLVEKLHGLIDKVTDAGPWAAFCLILLIVYVIENRANRRVTMQSTEALVALKTFIETTANKTTPPRRRK